MTKSEVYSILNAIDAPTDFFDMYETICRKKFTANIIPNIRLKGSNSKNSVITDVELFEDGTVFRDHVWINLSKEKTFKRFNKAHLGVKKKMKISFEADVFKYLSSSEYCSLGLRKIRYIESF